MFIRFQVFYSPNDESSSTTSAGDVEPAVESNDRDILDQEDEDAEDDAVSNRKGKVSEKDETEEEDEQKEDADSESEGIDGSEDEDEIEGDEEEEDEEDTEEELPDKRDLVLSDLTKAVKKEAPDLFKKIPGLREALERDKEFGEVFSTPDEAKIAARDASYLNAVYQDIASGDVDRTGNFLKAIKNTNEGAFEDFAHTVLESIGKVNPQLYGEVMLKPMKKALMAMYADALKSGNKNLAAVAIHAHNYWFDTQDIKAPLEERKKTTKTKEQEEWEKEKSEFENVRLSEFKSGITEVVNHSMKLSITKELDGIKLDDYQKRNVIRDIFAGVDEILGSDKRYLNGIQSLFDQARSSKYSPDWKTRIVKAYLQRARQALPGIRNKVLREAGIKAKDSPKSESRRLVPAGLGGNKSEEKIDFSRVDRSRTTDMDILNNRPKYLGDKR
jgi:hypothetical protein